MEKITLYYQKSPGLTVSIKLYFTDEDKLMLDGYDFGSVVEDLKGKDEYEYCITVGPDDIKKLYAVFDLHPDDRPGLLDAIRSRFSTNDAFTRFATFMDSKQIEHSKFFW